MLNWSSKLQKDWDDALQKYKTYLPNALKRVIDYRVSLTTQSIIVSMSASDFYDYLHNTFYVWKYTAANRLATTRAQLVRHHDDLLSSPACKLEQIKNYLCNPKNSDYDLICKATTIPGLGVAGATALLATMYPERFGTIDQFVVRNLQVALPTDPMISRVNPVAIRVREAVYIEELLREKARDLNALFKVSSWTPRAVDKAVWADR